MAAIIDPLAKLRSAGLALAAISHPTLQASGIGGHSSVTFSAKSAVDTFSRVSNPRSALKLQAKTQSLSAGLRLASGLSAGLHRSKMGVIHNMG